MFNFTNVARLPHITDNVAIATQIIPANSVVLYQGKSLLIKHTVLVGHRFAIRDIVVGENLYSWTQPFGVATQPIQAGEYVLNDTVRKELKQRSLDITLPSTSNFRDDLAHYQFDESTFTPATPLTRYDISPTFMGYAREGERGVGTRNMIIVLGTSSLVAGYVRKLTSQLQRKVEEYINIDGIAPIAHTEGAYRQANNHDLLLRTLAGFVVHPNVGAVLLVDYGHEGITSELLKDYLNDHNYPLDAVIHDSISLSTSFDDDMQRGKYIITSWFEAVNQMTRTPQPINNLKIALQCGGSDAFSGISGNPLVAHVAKELIQHGGSANLAETDELIGAETYVLDKVRDADREEIPVICRTLQRACWMAWS